MKKQQTIIIKDKTAKTMYVGSTLKSVTVTLPAIPASTESLANFIQGSFEKGKWVYRKQNKRGAWIKMKKEELPFCTTNNCHCSQ